MLGPEQAERFRSATGSAARTFKGRTIWNVNSTARGGGVAEMLQSLLAYARGAGIDARWLVIGGDQRFFEITKRIHNNLHNYPGDGGELGEAEKSAYVATLAACAPELEALIGPDDIVLLHDPQTAGLIPAIKAIGAPVVWRCHVGIDAPGEFAHRAWNFLLPFVTQADAYVFSRESFVWDGLDPARIAVIAPVIDAFSPKNEELDDATVSAILDACGILDARSNSEPVFIKPDETTGTVTTPAELFEESRIGAEDAIVLQVSRWDALKDPMGVINGFAQHVAPGCDAHLLYAGPAVEAVSDDPEGREILDASVQCWRELPEAQRRKVHLACLPMTDSDENAAIVNALQRHATVVVQKSLAEGFGLTVAEAMWKGRPVVATRIGGIQDQIEDGVTGVLLSDPSDLETFGQSVVTLLNDSTRAEEMGRAAHASVRDNFLGARGLIQYMELLGGLIEDGA